MPLTVSLLVDIGQPIERVVPRRGFLEDWLPEMLDPGYAYLSVIDRQGYTIFNRLQIDGFLAEWQAVDTSRFTPEHKITYDDILELARRVTVERLLLEFEGD